MTDQPADVATDSFGDTVLFFSNREKNNWDVYTVDFSGGAVTNLTQNPTNDGMATFSPDGSKIAFVSDRDGQWAVWVMNVDGSNPFKCFDLKRDLGAEWTGERLTWIP